MPANASLVIAGDVKASDAKALAERYFGSIPSPPGSESKPAAPLPLPKLDKVVRETIEDHVEMTKIMMAFHSPAHFQPGDAELDLFSSILSSGKSSRLYKALVYEKALAQSVSATQESSALSSMFTIEIMVRPGVSVDVAEKAADDVLAEAIAKPPSPEELQRAKNQIAYEFVDHLQSIAARARLINMYWGELGDPNYVSSRHGSLRAGHRRRRARPSKEDHRLERARHSARGSNARRRPSSWCQARRGEEAMSNSTSTFGVRFFAPVALASMIACGGSTAAASARASPSPVSVEATASFVCSRG